MIPTHIFAGTMIFDAGTPFPDTLSGQNAYAKVGQNIKQKCAEK